jgi:hypothetical protein
VLGSTNLARTGAGKHREVEVSGSALEAKALVDTPGAMDVEPGATRPGGERNASIDQSISQLNTGGLEVRAQWVCGGCWWGLWYQFRLLFRLFHYG